MTETRPGSALAVLRQIHYGSPTYPNFAKLPGDPPRSTMDVRWIACTDHHLACDCREGALAEEISELRGEAAEMRRLTEMAEAIGKLHVPDPVCLLRSRQGLNPSLYCGSCSVATPWPCPTLVLVAEIDWRTKYQVTEILG